MNFSPHVAHFLVDFGQTRYSSFPQKPQSNCGFQASLFSERRTLLKGANKRNLVHICHIFRPLWTEFNPGDVHNSLLSDIEFRNHRRGEGNRVLTGEFKITFTHVLRHRMNFRK